MPIIIILLTITTIAGWSVAAWLIRRSTKNAECSGATALTADDFTLDLADLSTNLALQATLDGVFRAAGEWICNAGKYSYIIFYVYDHASHELTNPMVVGREMRNLPRRLRLVSNAYGGVLNTRQPHLAEWPARSPNFGPTSQDVQNAYIVPLFQSGVALGVMCLQSVQPNAFPDSQRPVLDRAGLLIAAHAAIATRLADSHAAAERFDRFQMLAQRLTSHLDTKSLLSDVAEAAREMLDTPMSILLETDANGTGLTPVAWSGISDETALGIRSQGKEDLKGLVAWAKKPARTSDIRTDPRSPHAAEAVVAGMMTELAVPVMFQ